VIYKKNITIEECENAVDEICQLCHKNHISKYGKEALGCAFQSFDNTYCDKVLIFKSLIKEHFDNPPLKLDEIELGMWVWDKKYNAYRLIADFEFEFESGRFYKRQVEE